MKAKWNKEYKRNQLHCSFNQVIWRSFKGITANKTAWSHSILLEFETNPAQSQLQVKQEKKKFEFKSYTISDQWLRMAMIQFESIIHHFPTQLS